jgi:hypothetical protein
MMTYEEVVVQGMARVEDFARSYPAVRSVLYRRIGIRQGELALMAARANRDYFGVASIATLAAGAADLNDIAEPVPAPELIQKITVNAVGAGAASAVGDEVSIVRLGDETAEEAPRVTIRSGVIRQVGNDLANVTSLKVYYSRLPAMPLATENGASLVAIPDPYSELLVLDIAERVVDRAMRGEGANDPARKLVADEIKEWEGKWMAHVDVFGASRSRFER